MRERSSRTTKRSRRSLKINQLENSWTTDDTFNQLEQEKQIRQSAPELLITFCDFCIFFFYLFRKIKL